jgi:hypothetical protein
MEAMEKLGRHMKLYKGLPVPDVDWSNICVISNSPFRDWILPRFQHDFERMMDSLNGGWTFTSQTANYRLMGWPLLTSILLQHTLLRCNKPHHCRFTSNIWIHNLSWHIIPEIVLLVSLEEEDTVKFVGSRLCWQWLNQAREINSPRCGRPHLRELAVTRS